MSIATEQLFRVHDEKERVFLEIGESPDNPEYMELRTTDGVSIEWWGEINISFPPEFAYQLGMALVNAAKAKAGITN